MASSDSPSPIDTRVFSSPAMFSGAALKNRARAKPAAPTSTTRTTRKAMSLRSIETDPLLQDDGTPFLRENDVYFFFLSLCVPARSVQIREKLFVVVARFVVEQRQRLDPPVDREIDA